MPGGKGTRRQTTRPLALGLLAVLAGVAAPRDSYGVSVGRGQSVHFTIGETRGGVPGSEGKRRAINTPAPTGQGRHYASQSGVCCLCCRGGQGSSASNAAQKQQTSRAYQQQEQHIQFGERERAFEGPITRLKFVRVRVRVITRACVHTKAATALP